MQGIQCRVFCWWVADQEKDIKDGGTNFMWAILYLLTQNEWKCISACYFKSPGWYLFFNLLFFLPTMHAFPWEEFDCKVRVRSFCNFPKVRKDKEIFTTSQIEVQSRETGGILMHWLQQHLISTVRNLGYEPFHCRLLVGFCPSI